MIVHFHHAVVVVFRRYLFADASPSPRPSVVDAPKLPPLASSASSKSRAAPAPSSASEVEVRSDALPPGFPPGVGDTPSSNRRAEAAPSSTRVPLSLTSFTRTMSASTSVNMSSTASITQDNRSFFEVTRSSCERKPGVPRRSANDNSWSSSSRASYVRANFASNATNVARRAFFATRRARAFPLVTSVVVAVLNNRFRDARSCSMRISISSTAARTSSKT